MQLCPVRNVVFRSTPRLPSLDGTCLSIAEITCCACVSRYAREIDRCGRVSCRPEASQKRTRGFSRDHVSEDARRVDQSGEFISPRRVRAAKDSELLAPPTSGRVQLQCASLL